MMLMNLTFLLVISSEKKKNQLKTNPTEKYASITFKAIFSKTIFSQFPLLM